MRLLTRYHAGSLRPPGACCALLVSGYQGTEPAVAAREPAPSQIRCAPRVIRARAVRCRQVCRQESRPKEVEARRCVIRGAPDVPRRSQAPKALSERQQGEKKSQRCEADCCGKDKCRLWPSLHDFVDDFARLIPLSECSCLIDAGFAARGCNAPLTA